MRIDGPDHRSHSGHSPSWPHPQEKLAHLARRVSVALIASLVDSRRVDQDVAEARSNVISRQKPRGSRMAAEHEALTPIVVLQLSVAVLVFWSYRRGRLKYYPFVPPVASAGSTSFPFALLGVGALSWVAPFRRVPT